MNSGIFFQDELSVDLTVEEGDGGGFDLNSAYFVVLSQPAGRHVQELKGRKRTERDSHEPGLQGEIEKASISERARKEALVWISASVEA